MTKKKEKRRESQQLVKHYWTGTVLLFLASVLYAGNIPVVGAINNKFF
jgi:hypothetical protein